MIRAVTFTNYLGDSIRLDLARPEESGFIIKSANWLGTRKKRTSADGNRYKRWKSVQFFKDAEPKHCYFSCVYVEGFHRRRKTSFHTSIFLLKEAHNAYRNR